MPLESSSEPEPEEPLPLPLESSPPEPGPLELSADVWKILPDGTIDRSFGNNGSGRVSRAPGAVAEAIQIDSQGRLVIAGEAGDNYFGAPGYVRLSFATSLDILKGGLDRLESFLTGTK